MPTLNTVAGGTLPARTYYVQLTYVNENGETTPSVEASIAIAANYLLQVTSPASVDEATGYNVYASATSGSEELQAGVTIGTDWTEPASGLVTGTASPPITNTTPYWTPIAVSDLNDIGTPNTSVLNDDAGLGVTATWGSIAAIPDTIVGHNLNGVVQEALPPASLESILTNDGNGNLSWEPKYGSEMNFGGDTPGDGAFSSTSTVQIGNTIIIPNPGKTVTLTADWLAYPKQSGSATTSYRFVYYIRYSKDGGTTWINGGTAYCYFGTTEAAVSVTALAKLYAENITPTGDIHIQAMGYLAAGAGGTFTINAPQLSFNIFPNSSFSITGGTLAASLPSTASASTTVTYPTTSGQASKSLTVSVSNAGTSPDSFSNAVTSGSGTITAGASAKTFTTTCNTLAAGSNTTVDVHSVVTDSTTPTAQVVTTSTCAITFSIVQGYSAISGSISINSAGSGCVNATGGGSCTAHFTANVSAAGGNGAYTYSNVVYSHTAGYNPLITSGATSSSFVVSDTEPTSKSANSESVTVHSSINDTRGTGAYVAAATGSLSFKNF